MFTYLAFSQLPRDMGYKPSQKVGRLVVSLHAILYLVGVPVITVYLRARHDNFGWEAAIVGAMIAAIAAGISTIAVLAIDRFMFVVRRR